MTHGASVAARAPHRHDMSELQNEGPHLSGAATDVHPLLPMVEVLPL
jgi:hypothetical protein